MTNDDLKRFYPVNGNQDKPESFVRYDKDGNIPGGSSSGAQIEKLDLVVGDPEVIYDTTDGITITSQGQITQGDSTYNVDVEQNIPIIAGEGITIDASEDGKSIVVKKDKLYQHNIKIRGNGRSHVGYCALGIMLTLSTDTPITSANNLASVLQNLNAKTVNSSIVCTGAMNYRTSGDTSNSFTYVTGLYTTNLSIKAVGMREDKLTDTMSVVTDDGNASLLNDNYNLTILDSIIPL